jgi:hypothetical protein
MHVRYIRREEIFIKGQSFLLQITIFHAPIPVSKKQTIYLILLPTRMEKLRVLITQLLENI